MFAIPIAPNELHEAQVRHEGMLHFKLYLFIDTSEPTPLVSGD